MPAARRRHSWRSGQPHLPDFFVKALSQHNVNFFTFVLGSVLYSFFYTVVSNRTSNSILGAWLMHASINTFGALVAWGSVPFPSVFAMPFLQQLVYSVAIGVADAGLHWPSAWPQ